MASTFLALPPVDPQPLGPGDSPTFYNLTLTALAMFGVVHTDNTGTLSTSLIVNADVDPAADIDYSKLELTGDIVNADIHVAAGIVYSKLSLTNSIVNADINATAAIVYSKLNLTGSIVDADISALAAISRAKVAAGSANHVIINDGTGLLSSEAALAVSRGGTGVGAAFTTGSVIFSNGATLAEDNTNFFWDDSTNRLGVGINSSIAASVHAKATTSATVALLAQGTTSQTANLLSAQDVSGNLLSRIDAAGNIELAASDRTISITAAPLGYVDNTITLSSVVEVPMWDFNPSIIQNVNGSGGGTQFQYIGIFNRPEISNISTNAFNIDIIAALYDGTTLTADSQTITSTGLLTFVSAPSLGVTGGGVLNVTNQWSFLSQLSINTGATVTTRRGFVITDAIGSGTVTNQTGLYVASLTKGTNNFAIETAGTTNSRLGGKLQLGSSAVSPSGMLDINNIASTDVSIQIDGAASQSANYIDINTSVGALVFNVTSAGQVQIPLSQKIIFDADDDSEQWIQATEGFGFDNFLFNSRHNYTFDIIGTAASGYSFQLGVDTSTQYFKVTNNSLATLFQVTGDGSVSFKNYTIPLADGSSNQYLKTNGAGAVSFATIALSEVSGAPKIVTKTADEDLTSSTVFMNDNHLTFAIAASETWTFRMVLFCTAASATPDIKFQLTGPAGATTIFGVFDVDGTPTTVIEAFSTPTGVFALTTAVECVEIAGTVYNDGNAGSVTLQWAQNTSSLDFTRVKKGSYLNAFKI